MFAGVSTACLYPMLTEDGLAAIGMRGIERAEIFLNTYSELEPQFTRELKEYADFYGISIISAHPFTSGFEPFMFFSEYERRFSDALDIYRKYFSAMNEIDASILVFHGDRLASTLEDEKYYERFAILRDLGKEYGVIVAQENVERCKSRSLPFLEKMAAYLDGDLALVFDNKQALRSEVDYSDFIQKLGRHIVHIHLSDSNDDCDCLPIGYGNADIKDLLLRMQKIGYEGTVVVELYNHLIDSNEDIFTCYQNLCEIIKEIPDIPPDSLTAKPL